MRLVTIGLLVIGLAGAVRAAAAQAPQAASAAQGAPPAAQAPVGRGGQPAPAKPAGAIDAARTDQLIEPPGFAYNAEGRRDPFVSLLRRGTDARSSAGAARPAGLGGLSVNDITLRGTVRSREGFVAILQGADQRTYIVRAGDRLLDGTIRTISQNDMVILQQVNDPLSLDKQREVRKVLRQTEAN